MRRLLTDESAQTSLEYVVVTVFTVIGLVFVGRILINFLGQYLRRIYFMVTLPIP